MSRTWGEPTGLLVKAGVMGGSPHVGYLEHWQAAWAQLALFKELSAKPN